MPFNGDTFTREQSWVNNDALGIKIRADLMDNDTNDIAFGMSQVAARITALAVGPFTGYVSAVPLAEPIQTATAGQTVFPITTFAYAVSVPNAVALYVDGFKLPSSDITQTSSTSVTVANAMLGGEQVEIISGSFSSIMGGKVAAQDTSSNAAIFGPSYEFRRNVEYSGGDPTKVNSAVRAVTFVDNAAAATFEWTFLAEMHNSATGGENVAGYLQGTKNAGAGPTWGSVIECIDLSGGNPTTGALALEIDIRGNGTDSHTARIGIDIAATVLDNSAPGTTMTASYGVRFQSNNNANVTFGAFIGAAPGVVAGLGIDLSPAVLVGAALKLANAQAVQFDTSVLQSTSDNGLDHVYGGALKNRMLKTGGYQVGGAQVIGARATGWFVDTGTASRAAHATYADTAAAGYSQSQIQLLMTAVTNVTQAMKAMKDDQFTHGLIGT